MTSQTWRTALIFSLVVTVGCAEPPSQGAGGPLNGAEGASSESGVSSENTASSENVVDAVEKWTPKMTWDIQTTPGTYDMPESIVFLEVEGLRIPVADGPGLNEMSLEQRDRFRVPETAEWSAAGYYAGFGVNVKAESRNDSLVVGRAIWDEQADPALGWTYAPQVSLAFSDLKQRVDSGGKTLSACFSGINGTTTSTFQLQVKNGSAHGEHSRTIEDHDMGYFTSAQSVGDGTMVGNVVYLSLVTQIEYDVQKAVEIWTLTPDGLLYEDFVYPSCPKGETN